MPSVSPYLRHPMKSSSISHSRLSFATSVAVLAYYQIFRNARDKVQPETSVHDVLTALAGPGDALYIPPYWFHYVEVASSDVTS